MIIHSFCLCKLPNSELNFEVVKVDEQGLKLIG